MNIYLTRFLNTRFTLLETTFGQKVLYLFVEEDDAERFAMMLEERGYPEMSIIEVEDRSAIQICEHN